MKLSLVVAIALAAGFIGGFLGGRAARLTDQSHRVPLIRARAFELIDDDGKVISYWGVDKRGDAVLAFSSHWGVPPSGRDTGHAAHGLTDPEDQRLGIGVIDDSPFLFFTGPDKKRRMSLSLNIFQKPILWMGDENGRRLFLGVQQSDTPGPQDNDWALDFEPDMARIGMYNEKEGGTTYLRGLWFVNKNRVMFPSKKP